MDRLTRLAGLAQNVFASSAVQEEALTELEEIKYTQLGNPCSDQDLRDIVFHLDLISESRLKEAYDVHFLDARFMHYLNCLMDFLASADLYHSTFRQFVRKFTQIGGKTAEGFAFVPTGNYDQPPDLADLLVIKVTRDMSSIVHEGLAGRWCLNTLRNKVPTFTWIYSAFPCGHVYLKDGAVRAWCEEPLEDQDCFEEEPRLTTERTLTSEAIINYPTREELTPERPLPTPSRTATTGRPIVTGRTTERLATARTVTEGRAATGTTGRPLITPESLRARAGPVPGEISRRTTVRSPTRSRRMTRETTITPSELEYEEEPSRAPRRSASERFLTREELSTGETLEPIAPTFSSSPEYGSPQCGIGIGGTSNEGQCQSPYKQHPHRNYLLMERVNGPSLGKFITTCSEQEFIDLIVQILNALSYADEEFSYVHGDLHSGNVLVETLSEPVTIKLNPQLQMAPLVVNHLARIIDYGYSSFVKDGIRYRRPIAVYTGVVYDHQPMFDVYKLICFCGESAEKTNPGVFAACDTIYGAFGQALSLQERVAARAQNRNDYYAYRDKDPWTHLDILRYIFKIYPPQTPSIPRSPTRQGVITSQESDMTVTEFLEMVITDRSDPNLVIYCTQMEFFAQYPEIQQNLNLDVISLINRDLKILRNDLNRLETVMVQNAPILDFSRRKGNLEVYPPFTEAEINKYDQEIGELMTFRDGLSLVKIRMRGIQCALGWSKQTIGEHLDKIRHRIRKLEKWWLGKVELVLVNNNELGNLSGGLVDEGNTEMANIHYNFFAAV